MDFERIVIKTLFYDMPVEVAVKRLENADEKSFLSDFLAVARKSNMTFTESELNLLRRDFVDVWCKINNKNFAYLPIWSKCFKVLFRISDSLLCMDDAGYPIVHFNELLRWRMFCVLTGEDLFTAAKLAKYAYEHHFQPNSFAWSDVLTHDETTINRILGKGMSDVHMHFGASLAIFNLSWISMMNDVISNSDIDAENLSGISHYSHSQESHAQISFSSQSYSLRTLWIVAAFLRKEIFKMLYLSQATNEFGKCFVLFKDEIERDKALVDIQTDINNFALQSFKDANGKRIDYALRLNTGSRDRKSIHIMECGERELIFHFFLKYQEGNRSVWRNAGYFYLYLLIKNRIRQELEHTNQLLGFLNFKHYQDRKVDFVPKAGLVKQNYHNLVVSSSIYSDKDKLELRVGESQPCIKFNQLQFRSDLFSAILSPTVLHDRLSLVYSFGKAAQDQSLANGVNRFAKQRKMIKKQCIKLEQELGGGFPYTIDRN